MSTGPVGHSANYRRKRVSALRLEGEPGRCDRKILDVGINNPVDAQLQTVLPQVGQSFVHWNATDRATAMRCTLGESPIPKPGGGER